jgi:hypothetical protein
MATELLHAPRIMAPGKEIRSGNVRAAPAPRHTSAPEPAGWPDMKTVIEIGLAVVRIVELAILFG